MYSLYENSPALVRPLEKTIGVVGDVRFPYQSRSKPLLENTVTFEPARIEGMEASHRQVPPVRLLASILRTSASDSGLAALLSRVADS
jgi:hypothetical protein